MRYVLVGQESGKSGKCIFWQESEEENNQIKTSPGCNMILGFAYDNTISGKLLQGC